MADDLFETIAKRLNELGQDGPIAFDSQPYLEKDDVVFKPRIITRFSLILPWENESDQTLCGETIVNNEGDINARVTMEGYVFYSELIDLFTLRESAENVRLNWNGGNETGITTVSFDRLQIERRDEEDVGLANDMAFPEPLYEFQLQNKEDSGSNDSNDGLNGGL